MTITIRNSQSAVFREMQTGLFVATLLPKLRALFAHDLGALTDPELTMLVSAAVRAAQGYGIEHRSGLANYVAYRFYLGEGFDDSPLLPRFKNILRTPNIDGIGKMARLDAEFRSVFLQGLQENF